ncbi:MAG TPA: MmgE/PrpD family protein [Hyphomonadaceae bacterium]|nr:MmgE/PrpD family protein [Hyphomonadaceae bacterium]
MKRSSGVSRRHAMAVVGALPAAVVVAQAVSRPVDAQTPAPEASGPVTPALAAYIAGIRTAKIPDEHRDLARQHILDTLASAVACRDLEPSVLARKYAEQQSGGATRNAATMIATRQKASLSDAVFASAMTAHAAEINDFIPSAFVQPGPAIVSAALGLAETRKLSGDAVVRAVIAGYELAGRVPKALGSGNLRNAGLANHGIGPVFGTAATAASLIGIPENRISDLLTYCAQQASGSWQWLMDVEHIEKAFVFAGMGARNGLQAALMVEAGFRGVRDSFDNPEGWLRAGAFKAGDAKPGYLVEQLGVRTELRETAFKRYPVGGPTQPAIHGMYELLPKIDRNNVASVRVEMPGRWQAFRDAAMPALNLRYTLSLMLIDGKLDFVSAQSLQRMANDARVKALMEKVTIAHDPAQEAPAGQPRTESARLTVVETNSKRHEIYVPYVVGFPSHPMSRAEVEAKAMELMSPSLGSARARQVVDRVGALETMRNAADLIPLIAS